MFWFCHLQPEYRATKWRPDLSISAPGRWVARMPGTGPPRRSSAPARIKAIVGKSRVGATRVQRATRIAFSPRWLSWFMTPARTLETDLLRIKVSEQEAAKPNLQLALFSPLEPYLPTRQAPGEEDLLVLPAQLAVFVHQACCHPGIGQLHFCGGVRPARVPVQFRRTTHPQRFVGALLVKLLSPQLQRLGRCSLTQAFQLFSDVPMQSFVPSVILGMRRPTSFQIDPQGHPPRRQPAQSVQGLHAGKGRPIIRADRFR